MATLSRIAPEIPVADIQHAITFYVEKMGFHLAMQLPAGDYAIVERDGIAIHLFESNSSAYVPVGVHIFTSELDELHNELLDRGATISQGILTKPWGNRDFRVNDCSGNTLKFTEPLASD
jgi:uncharacterized glyoxalase superfamily protein PhnB